MYSEAERICSWMMYTVPDVEGALQVPVNIVKSSGYDLVDALLGISDSGRNKKQELETEEIMAKRKSKPIVAVVGRPNVGKSTLFNALAGENISIVKDTPGITRDRIYADIHWLDMTFTLIDTGGIEPDSKDVILSQMREQAEIAMKTADVIIFLVDVRQGLVDADSKVADMLRRSHKPVVLVVNKVDSFQKYMADVYEFYNLGIGDPHPISAVNRWESVTCWRLSRNILIRSRRRKKRMTAPVWLSLETQCRQSLP